MISGKNKLSKYASHEEHGQLKDVVPQVKDDEPCDVEVEKKYGDDFNRFYVTLTGKDEPEDKVLITLSREGFFFWARHKRSFAVWRLISELVCTRS